MTEASVEEWVEAKANEVWARGGAELNRLRDKVLPALLASQAPPRRKYWRLYQIADQAAAIVAPSTPCRKGCSDCCYQAVPISLEQARILSEGTGRPLDEAAGRPVLSDLRGTIDRANAKADALLADPKPCPFLKDNACSAYEARPVACRVHHVLHADASRCSLFHHKKLPIAKFDLKEYDEAAAMLGLMDAWADIRDFFPTKE